MAELILQTVKNSLIIEAQDSTLEFGLTKNELILSSAGTRGATGVNTWGSILGDISNQTDLQTELDGKATSAQGVLADSAIQPNDNISELVNDANYLVSTDIQIIQNVGDTTKVFSKTGDLVTGIAYSDKAGATNHTKTFVWTTVSGSNAVDSIVEVFDYEGQTWTYTKAFTYPTSDAGAPTITPTLTKV